VELKLVADEFLEVLKEKQLANPGGLMAAPPAPATPGTAPATPDIRPAV
jgi:hypothetical protein